MTWETVAQVVVLMLVGTLCGIALIGTVKSGGGR